MKLCIVIFSTARATWVLNNIFIIEKSTNFVVRSRKLHNFYFLLFARRKKNEAKPNGICHHHFTSDNKIIRTYTQIVHNMLDFTLLTYTKGLGVMLTENCEKSYFHEIYQNLSKKFERPDPSIDFEVLVSQAFDYGTLKVEIAFQCIISKFKNYELRNQMKDTLLLLKVNQFRKQIFFFSFEPKTQLFFFDFCPSL